MKKLLFLSIILSVLLVLGACNKDSDSNSATKEPVSKGKDSELVIEVDGKEQVIPAKVEKNISFIKEIKVPKESEVVKNKEDDAVIITLSDFKMSINKRETNGNSEILIEDYKSEMELSEPGGNVPVVDIELSKYPDLEEYDAMVKKEGTKTIAYYLVKMHGKTKVEEIKASFPVNTNEEKVMAELISILNSVKY